MEQADSTNGGDWGSEWKKVKLLAKEHTCIDTDNSVVMARGKMGGMFWVKVDKVGENGDICNILNNEN